MIVWKMWFPGFSTFEMFVDCNMNLHCSTPTHTHTHKCSLMCCVCVSKLSLFSYICEFWLGCNLLVPKLLSLVAALYMSDIILITEFYFSIPSHSELMWSMFEQNFIYYWICQKSVSIFIIIEGTLFHTVYCSITLMTSKSNLGYHLLSLL